VSTQPAPRRVDLWLSGTRGIGIRPNATAPLRGAGRSLAWSLRWSGDWGGIEMTKTHDSNKVAGIYACDSCGERITMPIGHEFPPCPGCGKAVTYTLAVATK
jgi:predicted RNA-binding Zn-ribbon protein involved in translation (DUF1610 family)